MVNMSGGEGHVQWGPSWASLNVSQEGERAGGGRALFRRGARAIYTGTPSLYRSFRQINTPQNIALPATSFWRPFCSSGSFIGLSLKPTQINFVGNRRLIIHRLWSYTGFHKKHIFGEDVIIVKFEVPTVYNLLHSKVCCFLSFIYFNVVCPDNLNWCIFSDDRSWGRTVSSWVSSPSTWTTPWARARPPAGRYSSPTGAAVSLNEHLFSVHCVHSHPSEGKNA